MAATKLPATNRFFAPGISKAFWLPSIASAVGAWTRAEQTAGDDLSDEVRSVSGFGKTPSMIDTPDWSSLDVAQIPGRNRLQESSITFYWDKSGHDVRDVLSVLDEGFLVLCDGGDVPDFLSDVFKSRIAAIGKVRPENDANTLVVTFALQKAFENVVIPAAG